MDNTIDKLLASMKNPSKYLQQLSDADLAALDQDNLNSVSDEGLKILEQGQQDLGALEFLDIGTSITGALSGAALGAAVGGPFAPATALVGGVIGGALGAFGGEVAEDLIAKRDIDYSFTEGGASYEAAQSVMWDAAFMGGGKIIRPVVDALGISPSRLWNRVTGADPGVITKPATVPVQDFPRDSLEARQQLQQILTPRGGTLTAYQTGRAPWIREFSEQIANVGFISRDVLARNTEKNTEILSEGLQELYRGIDPTLAKTSADLGSSLVDVVMTGKKLVGSYYGAGLEALKSKVSGKVTSTDIINKTLSEFSQESKDMLGTALRKNTEKTMGDLSSDLSRTSPILDQTGNPFRLSKTTDVKALIRWQQDLTQAIDDLSPFYNNVNADAVAARQLKGLEVKVKDAITRTIARIDPKAAVEYKKLNKFYATSLNSLLPKGISQTIITAGDRQLYTTIGNLISGTASDIGKTEQLLSSIDSAFKIAKKTKQKFTGDINSPERAKALVRQSFISARISDPAVNGVDLKKLSAISNQLKTNEGAKLYKTVLGDDYASFKTFVDASTIIGDEPAQGVLSLAIRGRELGAAFQVAGTAASTALVSGAGLPSAVIIFGMPIMAAKIATNKRAVNKLLMLDSRLRKNPLLRGEDVAAQVAKIIEEFSDEDMEDIIEGLF